MGSLELVWILIGLLALQPVLARQISFMNRQAAIARIERSRGSRLILLIHREETVQFLGIPVMRFIDMQDAEAIARAIALTDPDTPIDMVIHTPGGLMLAAVQIARALKRHKGDVTVFVPHYAMSGGALVALAADQIVMAPHAVLGAVDPQVEGLPASSLLKVVGEKPIGDVDDETLILADMAAKALDEIITEVKNLLGDEVGADKAAEIAEALAGGRWTHEYGISASQAGRIGLPVKDEIPADILSLMDYYPQPVRRTPSVAFSPTWRTRRSAAGASQWRNRAP
jgi:ClpP class serine protease